MKRKQPETGATRSPDSPASPRRGRPPVPEAVRKARGPRTNRGTCRPATQAEAEQVQNLIRACGGTLASVAAKARIYPSDLSKMARAKTARMSVKTAVARLQAVLSLSAGASLPSASASSAGVSTSNPFSPSASDSSPSLPQKDDSDV